MKNKKNSEIKLDKNLQEIIRMLAKIDHRSLDDEIKVLLYEAIEQRLKKGFQALFRTLVKVITSITS